MGVTKLFTLPAPGETYNPGSERNRNRTIEQYLKLVNSSIYTAPYSGTPYTALKGSSAAFDVPAGTTPTILPFDTNYSDTDPYTISVPASGAISVTNESAYMIFISVQHNATGSGNLDVSLSLLINSVIIETVSQSITLNQNFQWAGTFLGLLPANQLTQFAMTHSGSGNFSINMTNSRWWLVRMSPDVIPL